jgi:hypothetical protein
MVLSNSIQCSTNFGGIPFKSLYAMQKHPCILKKIPSTLAPSFVVVENSTSPFVVFP